MSLLIVEGISGTWFYHMATSERPSVSLCGKRVMHTSIPLSYWASTSPGSHIPEKWCSECERLRKAMKEDGRGD